MAGEWLAHLRAARGARIDDAEANLQYVWHDGAALACGGSEARRAHRLAARGAVRARYAAVCVVGPGRGAAAHG